MSHLKGRLRLTEDAAMKLEVQAAKAFQPRAPITTKELFAGRWDQITTLADAVSQPGLHVVIYGERGVGKTSLANVVRPIIFAFDSPLPDESDEDTEQNDDAANGREKTPQRIVIKANANSGDSFSSIWEKLFENLTWVDDAIGIGFRPRLKGHVRPRCSYVVHSPRSRCHASL